ncbi:MAG: PAS-domain containing protein [Alphaproteobacteria bacterium]|nr:PAS-domain containing protein [Alphaproteobacteria bacterium]
MARDARDNLEIKVAERTKELGKLSVAIEQSSVSVVITDLKGTIEYVNPQFTKVSGYTFEEALGQNPRILNSGQNDPQIYEDMWSTLLDGRTWHGDLLNSNKSGEVLWETVNISPITAADGEITHFVGVKEDITERKRAEDALVEKQEQLRIALKYLPGAMFMLDADLNLVLLSDKVHEFFELPEDLTQPGKNAREGLTRMIERGDYGPGDVEQMVADRLATFRSREPLEAERMLRSGRTVRINQAPIPGGGVVVVAADISDVVDSQRGAKLLREALDTFTDMVILYDKDERVVFTNYRYHEIYPSAPSKEEITNYTMEQLLRRSLEVGQINHPLALSDPEAWLTQAMERRRDPAGGEGETTHANGHTYFFRQRRTTEGGMILVQIDITERKKAEEQIRQGQELLDSIFEGTPFPLLVVRASDAAYVKVNPAACELFGRSEEELLSTHATEVYVDPGDREKFLEARGETGKSRDFEVQLRNFATGEGRWCLLSSFEVTFEGEAANVAAIVDITERRAAEDLLRNSERRLQHILENSPIAVGISLDDNSPEDGVIQYANARFAELVGFDLSEVGTVRTSEFTLESVDREDHERALDAGEVMRDMETRIIRRDGEAFWGLLSIMPIEYQGRKSALVWLYDISRLKEVEEAVSRQATLLNDVLENTIQGVGAFDGGLRVLACNTNYQRILDLTEEMVQPGQHLRPISERVARYGSLGEGDPVDLATARMAMLSSGERVSGEFNAPDGGVYLAASQPTADGGFVITYTDIADQKAAEEELREARNAAEAATRAKSSFLAAMSHEIRTPMNGVVGMIDLLGETEMKLDQRQMMTTIRDSAFSLLQIINDILDFSKIEAGKLELEALPISLRDAVEGVVETMTPIAEKKGVLLTTYVDPALPAWVTGDQVRLRQVLFNLAGNAVKFTDSGDGRQGVVDVSAELLEGDDEGATARFSVTDTGIGMDQSQIEHLFEAFTQAEDSTTRRFGGTGLGLSICKNLVEIMGGTITARSSPGEGSTFTVELPIEPDDSRPLPGDEPDLQGVPVLLLAQTPEKNLRCQTYLEAWHAEPDWCSGSRECAGRLRDLAKRGDGYVVLLICSDVPAETRQTLIDDLRGSAGLERLRFVVLSHHQGERFGMIKPDKVVIRDRPLKRSALIHGVAVAVGRASPEMPQEVERIGVAEHDVPTPDEARLAGQLILLAEDNLTNQDVIRRQVNRLGYALEIADDGVQALEMLRTGKYGLLLTDCHMPNKDGYELTEEIRAAEAGGPERLPIIAITANALQGEADRCLAAGMDDYLAKPVELRLLKRKLASWLPRQPSHTQGGGSPVIHAEPADPVNFAPPTDEPPVDLNAIKELIGDDDEMAREVLQDFVAPAADNVSEILASWRQQDAAAVGAGAHKLKSSARTIGAHVMADLCFDLEQAGKAGDAGRIDQDIGKLEPGFEAIRDYIEKLTSA